MKDKKLINIISTFIYKKKDVVILLLNLLIGISLILLINIYYETNDDWYLSLISQGYFGNNTYQYMIYSNVVLGYILRALYLIFKTINWYVVFQLLLLTLSGYSIYRVVKNKSLFLSISINLLFWLTVLFSSFNSIEFTKTAGIISIIGLYSTYCSIINKDRINLALGLILSVFGFLYRNQSFLLTLPFILVIIIFDYLKKHLNRVQIKIVLQIFGLLAIIITSLFVIDRTHYQSDEWKEYSNYNDAIVEIFDYNKVPYDENKEQYKEISYSENDYKMIKEGINDDVLKFNADDLWKVLDQKRDSFKAISIKKFLKFLIEYANIKNAFVFITSILLVIITLSNKNTRNQSIIVLIIELLILFYLYYKGRYPDRVLNIVRTCHIVSNIYLLIKIDSIGECNGKADKILATLLAIILCFTIFTNKKIYHGDDVKFTDAIKNFKSNYVVDISYDNVEIQNQENPLLITDISSINNCDYIFSWMAGSPIITDNRIAKGLNVSPYMQLLEKGTYLITKTEYHANLIETYLQENYDKNIKKKYVDSIYCGKYVYLIYDYSLN